MNEYKRLERKLCLALIVGVIALVVGMGIYIVGVIGMVIEPALLSDILNKIDLGVRL